MEHLGLRREKSMVEILESFLKEGDKRDAAISVCYRYREDTGQLYS